MFFIESSSGMISFWGEFNCSQISSIHKFLSPCWKLLSVKKTVPIINVDVIKYFYGYIMLLRSLPHSFQLHGHHIGFKLTGVNACMNNLAKFMHVWTFWQRRSWPIKNGYKHEESYDLNYTGINISDVNISGFLTCENCKNSFDE